MFHGTVETQTPNRRREVPFRSERKVHTRHTRSVYLCGGFWGVPLLHRTRDAARRLSVEEARTAAVHMKGKKRARGDAAMTQPGEGAGGGGANEAFLPTGK